MKRFQKISLFLFASLLVSFASFAQEKEDDSYNPWSVRAIRKDDQMFKKSLWFRVDLRTKQNYPFFARENEITGLLVDAVKSGMIRPFRNDSLETRISLEQFMKNLEIPTDTGDDEFDKFEENDDVWKDGSSTKTIPQANEYLPRQLYIIEIKEDLIFDKRRSRMYEDVQAISIIVPGEQTKAGVDRVLASFSYKELVEKVFKNNPDAIWFNTQNSAEHRNLEDAFTLHLWNGTLVKYENPQNGTMVDMYNGGKAALMAAEQAIFKLLEYEATLWEY